MKSKIGINCTDCSNFPIENEKDNYLFYKKELENKFKIATIRNSTPETNSVLDTNQS